MAIYDNRHWLLSHIRNSFISTDDTGMCETVMLGEDIPKLLHMRCVAERGKMELSSPSKSTEDSSDEEYSREQVMEFDCYPEMDQSDEDDIDPLTESYELQHDMDFGMHRKRSNTAQKLEKMEAAQRKAARIKVIKWENPSGALTDQEREQIFNKKDSDSIQKQIKKKAKSLLSEQLDKCPLLPQNKYVEFAKYDGTAQFGLPTKTYKIFMTMLPEDQRNYPITISVVASAKILDLIGFTCYKYCILHPDCTLGPVSQYGLFICEDDGEVDSDFPCIDNKEACSKFAFNCLGLVDLKSHAALKREDIQTSSIPDKGGLHIMLEDKANSDATVRSRSATCDSKEKPRKRQDSMSSGLKNNETLPSSLAKGKRDGGPPVRSNTDTIVMQNTDRLKNLTFSNLPWGDGESSQAACTTSQDLEAINRFRGHEKAIEAPTYKSYKVRIVMRMVSNPPVLLGISGERIEIDPITTASNIFWPRIKPISHNIENVAWCEVRELKSNRSTFRITYSQTLNPEPSPSSGSSHHHNFPSPNLSFKHHDFECDGETAKEIVDKINRILNLQSSCCHKEYKAVREKKLFVRRSFHLSKSSQ